MSEKPIPFDRQKLQDALEARDDLAKREVLTDYVVAYERLLKVLHVRDYPDEIRCTVAAALAAAWVKSG